MAGRLDDALSFHENALRLRSQRQQVLASNIANADTPNYKARDLDFGKAMQSALSHARQSSATPLSTTQSAHLSPELAAQDPNLFFRKPTQNNLDGNTVDMDVERNAFAENAMRYEAGVTLAHDEIKGLLSVLQG
jgi:flagellar basal-body rod protein FlgB